MKQSRIDFALRVVRASLSTLENLDSASPDEPQIHVVSAVLDALARAPFDADEVDAILTTIRDSGELTRLRNLLFDAEHECEHYQAANMLEKDTVDYDEYVKTVYATLVGTEIDNIKEYLDLETLESCVFVGCGSLPLTPILINEYTGLKIRALDNQAACLSIGRKVVSQFGKSDKIEFVEVHGEIYDYADAKLVYVAAMVPDKPAVFAQIARTAPEALVLTRGGDKLMQMFYSKVDQKTLENAGWHCISTARHAKTVRNTSYLFTRMQQAA